MNAPEQTQGRHLHAETNNPLSGGGFFSTILSKLMARRFNKLLDVMDAGLLSGSVGGMLPDGAHRILGGRNPGPQAEMNIRDWRALGRIAWNGSVGLYEGWAKGEWHSPDPVQIFDLFVCFGF